MRASSTKGSQSLQLVGDQAAAPESTPELRIFEHWVFMLGKNPRRTAMGAARIKAIRRALELYDEETLLLAVEGCAASAWHAGANDRERPFNDLELILRDEAHIERFAEDGERLRQRALRAAAKKRAEAEQPEPLQPHDEAAAREARAALKALADRMAGREAAHG